MLSSAICRFCRSANQMDLDPEMNIHFPGLKSLAWLIH
jgi:hypothetical protein